MHDPNSDAVRRQALLLLLLVSWLSPSGRTGHKAQGHRLNVPGLARRVGVSEREIERYLVVLRSAGVLKVWQPPRTSGCARGNRTGHCFNLYELADGIPPELERHLAAFHRSWWPTTTEAKNAYQRDAGGAARAPSPSAALFEELNRRALEQPS